MNNERFPERYINVPRRRIALYVLKNGLAMFAGQVFFINIFIMVSICLWIYGVSDCVKALYPLWRSCGYSSKLFFAMYAVLFTVGFLPAWLLRERIFYFI